MSITIKKTTTVYTVDNSGDESKVYDIQAEVTVQDGSVQSVQSGQVSLNGGQLANFNEWGSSFNYNSDGEVDDAAIMAEVKTFIADAKAAVTA